MRDSRTIHLWAVIARMFECCADCRTGVHRDPKQATDRAVKGHCSAAGLIGVIADEAGDRPVARGGVSLTVRGAWVLASHHRHDDRYFSDPCP